MVKIAATLAAVLPLAAAFPAAMEMDFAVHHKRNAEKLDEFSAVLNEHFAKRQDDSGIRLHRKNTGLAHPDVPFDAKAQYVDTVNKYPFQSPQATDKRGECPGLNACANHGICPRSGIWTIQQSIDGLREAYGMTPELAAGLSVISILLSGDILKGTWSIGTGYKSSLPGVLSDPKGLTGLHNKYEGDASIVRGDAYLNNGHVGVFQYPYWQQVMDTQASQLDGDDEGNFTPSKSAKQNVWTRNYSIQNNPYYFTGQFSGLVTSAVRGFVVGFMSNHTAENPTGYLDKEILKAFFAVSGDKEGEYKVAYGQERIPDNWYKRPYGVAGEYGHSLADVFIELAAGAAEFPGSLQFLGGNTGTTNSYTGVDLSDLSGGVFNAAALTDPKKLVCFFYRAAQQGGIDQFDGALQVLNSAVTALAGQFSAAFEQFTCPELHQWNSQLFNIFPGYKYTGDPSSNSGDGSFNGDT